MIAVKNIVKLGLNKCHNSNMQRLNKTQQVFWFHGPTESGHAYILNWSPCPLLLLLFFFLQNEEEKPKHHKSKSSGTFVSKLALSDYLATPPIRSLTEKTSELENVALVI